MLRSLWKYSFSKSWHFVISKALFLIFFLDSILLAFPLFFLVVGFHGIETSSSSSLSSPHLSQITILLLCKPEGMGTFSFSLFFHHTFTHFLFISTVNSTSSRTGNQILNFKFVKETVYKQREVLLRQCSFNMWLSTPLIKQMPWHKCIELGTNVMNRMFFSTQTLITSSLKYDPRLSPIKPNGLSPSKFLIKMSKKHFLNVMPSNQPDLVESYTALTRPPFIHASKKNFDF